MCVCMSVCHNLLTSWRARYVCVYVFISVIAAGEQGVCVCVCMSVTAYWEQGMCLKISTFLLKAPNIVMYLFLLCLTPSLFPTTPPPPPSPHTHTFKVKLVPVEEEEVPQGEENTVSTKYAVYLDYSFHSKLDTHTHIHYGPTFQSF